MSENEQNGALLIGIEKLAYLVNRCKVYEEHFISTINHVEVEATSQRAVSNLKDALVALYASMLSFLATASRLYSKNTATRMLHGMLSPKRVADLVDDWGVLEQRAHIEAVNCGFVYHAAIQSRCERLLIDLRQPVVHLDSKFAAFSEREDTKDLNDAITWISDIAYEESHNTASRGRVEGTGEWLLKHERYLEWRGSQSSATLWLYGSPGCGKTKLVSKVIDDLLQNQKNHTGDNVPTTVAYFYCDRGKSDRRDPLRILRSFIRQLAMSSENATLRHMFVDMYKERQQQGFPSGQLNAEESRPILVDLVWKSSQTTLIVDGLDECNEGTRVPFLDELDNLVASLDTLVRADVANGIIDRSDRKPMKNIKILVSSRPNRDIKYSLAQGLNLQINATDNHADIAKFIEEEIVTHPPRNWQSFLGSDLLTSVQNTLLSKSEGMFQWTALQIQQLHALSREKDIRKRLGKLPKDLDKAYDEIYARIQAQDGSAPEIANRAFQWIMYSYWPLSPEVLLTAVCQESETGKVDDVDISDINVVLEACQNLVYVDELSNTCQFTHLSVREYLEDSHRTSLHANGQWQLAKVCLKLLNDPDLQTLPIFIQETVEQGLDGDHCDRTSDEGSGDNGKLQFSDDSGNSLVGQSSNSELWESGGEPWKRLGPIEYLVLYARLFWPMHVQAHGDQLTDRRLVKLLKRFLGSTHNSALAYRNWHENLTSHYEDEDNNAFLLSTELCDIYSDLEPSTTASFAVCRFGLHSILTGSWKHGLINVDEENSSGDSLLALAAHGGSLAMMTYLLDRGAKVDARDSFYGNVLQFVASEGSLPMAQLLIQRGANVNAKGGYYGTALQAACAEARTKMVRLLMRQGANVSARGGYYGNALQAACSVDGEPIVQLLLDRGAQVDAQCGHFHTVLIAASHTGLEVAVQLLLNEGADVNARSLKYGSALSVARAQGHARIVQMLRERGARYLPP